MQRMSRSLAEMLLIGLVVVLFLTVSVSALG